MPIGSMGGSILNSVKSSTSGAGVNRAVRTGVKVGSLGDGDAVESQSEGLR